MTSAKQRWKAMAAELEEALSDKANQGDSIVEEVDEDQVNLNNRSKRGGHQPSTTTRSNRSHNLSLNPLLAAGFAVPRWFMERTMELVIPASPFSSHHHNHNQHSQSHNHHHQSAMVRRVLNQNGNDDAPTSSAPSLDLAALQRKYAKEIKADAEIQALQKRIKHMRQQVQQYRSQRVKTEKKHISSRQRQRHHLDQARHKLEQALVVYDGGTAGKSSRDYSKALIRANNRKHKTMSSSSSNTASIVVNKLSQAAVKAAATPISLASSAAAHAVGTVSNSSTSSPSSSSSSPQSQEDKEAQGLEVSILRTMHQTNAYQHQTEIAQAYAQQLVSSLKRYRASLDQQQAEVAQQQMSLQVTTSALTTLYPEVAFQQETLIERYWIGIRTQRPFIPPRRDNGIPRLIVPTTATTTTTNRNAFALKTTGNNTGSTSSKLSLPIKKGKKALSSFHNKTSTTTKSKDANTTTTLLQAAQQQQQSLSFRSDGISSLGDSASKDDHSTSSRSLPVVFCPPGGPVFTSVAALQRQTLQQMAGVERY